MKKNGDVTRCKHCNRVMNPEYEDIETKTCLSCEDDIYEAWLMKAESEANE